jgi:hypothetical protein
MPRAEPRIAPYFSTAVMKYTLHEGWYRQHGPSQGLIAS